MKKTNKTFETFLDLYNTTLDVACVTKFDTQIEKVINQKIYKESLDKVFGDNNYNNNKEWINTVFKTENLVFLDHKFNDVSLEILNDLESGKGEIISLEFNKLYATIILDSIVHERMIFKNKKFNDFIKNYHLVYSELALHAKDNVQLNSQLIFMGYVLNSLYGHISSCNIDCLSVEKLDTTEYSLRNITSKIKKHFSDSQSPTPLYMNGNKLYFYSLSEEVARKGSFGFDFDPWFFHSALKDSKGEINPILDNILELGRYTFKMLPKRFHVKFNVLKSKKKSSDKFRR